MVRMYLDRIEQARHLNAYLEVFTEDALAQARSLDEKIRKGERPGLLAGVVVGIKDVICYKGHKVSAASRILEGLYLLLFRNGGRKVAGGRRHYHRAPELR